MIQLLHRRVRHWKGGRVEEGGPDRGQTTAFLSCAWLASLFDAPSHPWRWWQQWHRERLLLCFGFHDDSLAASLASPLIFACDELSHLIRTSMHTQYRAHTSSSLLPSVLLISYIQAQRSFTSTTYSRLQPLVCVWLSALLRSMCEALLPGLSFHIACSRHSLLRLDLVRKP